MSKRFGRNQRRKMREALTKAQDDLVKSKAETRYYKCLSEENADVVKFFDIVKDTVENYAAITGETHSYTSNSNRIPNRFCFEIVDKKAVKREIIRLIRLESVQNEINQDLAIRVKFGDGTVALGISRHMLEMCDESMLRHYITKHFTDYIVNEIVQSRK